MMTTTRTSSTINPSMGVDVVDDDDRDPCFAEEAKQILPIINHIRILKDQGEISNVDFCGGVMLAYLGIRHKRSWSAGRRCKQIDGEIISQSVLLSSIPLLLDVLNPLYLTKRLPSLQIETLTVLDVFINLKLHGLNEFVNDIIICWAQGLCPLVLMHRVPTPLEVLRQQANGERVVTVFVTERDLSRKHTAQLFYMDGNKNLERCPFEFLVHDLHHMHHFMERDVHDEQVGFFRCMLKLSPFGGHDEVVEERKMSNLKLFFLRSCGYDEKLWQELEYVMSDFNTYVPHLLKYTLAKMIIAGERTGLCAEAKACETKDGAEALREVADNATSTTLGCLTANQHRDDFVRELTQKNWSMMMILFGMRDQSPSTGSDGSPTLESACALSPYQAAMEMVSTAFRDRGAMTPEEGETLRDFFRAQAREPRSTAIGSEARVTADADDGEGTDDHRLNY